MTGWKNVDLFTKKIMNIYYGHGYLPVNCVIDFFPVNLSEASLKSWFSHHNVDMFFCH